MAPRNRHDAQFRRLLRGCSRRAATTIGVRAGVISFFSSVGSFVDDGAGAIVKHFYIFGRLPLSLSRSHFSENALFSLLTTLEKSTAEKRPHLPLRRLNALYGVVYSGSANNISLRHRSFDRNAMTVFGIL